MAWTPTLFNLRDTLADLFPFVNDAIQVVKKASLPTGKIAFDAAAYSNWFNILDYADKREKVRDIVEVAHDEYPENQVLEQYLEQGELPAIRGADIQDDIDWRAPTEPDTLEKIIGPVSTLLPISFLETGLEKAGAVARILREDGALGTGFLADGNLLVTNNHVLASEAEAQSAKVQFNYQLSSTGLALPAHEYELAPEVAFATSAADDWTVVQVQDDPAAQWGTIRLQRCDLQRGDRVNIIQHPMGGPKQIALYHNIVLYVGPNRIQYLTDTLPGSSGSPVFDSNWQVAALHHSGGYLREPGTKQVYYRNEGIHVNAVIDGLEEAGLWSA